METVVKYDTGLKPIKVKLMTSKEEAEEHGANYYFDTTTEPWTKYVRKVVRQKRSLLDELMADYENEVGFKFLYIDQRQPWTYVRFSFIWDAKLRYTSGWAKVCVPDVWDEQVGQDVAVRNGLRHYIKEHELRLEYEPEEEVVWQRSPG